MEESQQDEVQDSQRNAWPQAETALFCLVPRFTAENGERATALSKQGVTNVTHEESTYGGTLVTCKETERVLGIERPPCR